MSDDKALNRSQESKLARLRYNEKQEQDNGDLAALQSRQLDDLRSLESKHDRLRFLEEERLQTVYGPFQQRYQEDINALTVKLNQSGFKGWLFNTLHGDEARDDIIAAQRSMDSGQMRMDEQMNVLNTQASAELYELRETQQFESQLLQHQIDLTAVPRVRESVELETHIVDPALDLAPSRGRSR